MRKPPVTEIPRQRPSLQLRNLLGRLPREQQARPVGARRLEDIQKDGMAKFRQIANWLEQDYPDAAVALLEGLEE